MHVIGLFTFWFWIALAHYPPFVASKATQIKTTATASNGHAGRIMDAIASSRAITIRILNTVNAIIYSFHSLPVSIKTIRMIISRVKNPLG